MRAANNNSDLYLCWIKSAPDFKLLAFLDNWDKDMNIFHVKSNLSLGSALQTLRTQGKDGKPNDKFFLLLTFIYIVGLCLIF